MNKTDQMLNAQYKEYEEQLKETISTMTVNINAIQTATNSLSEDVKVTFHRSNAKGNNNLTLRLHQGHNNK